MAKKPKIEKVEEIEEIEENEEIEEIDDESEEIEEKPISGKKEKETLFPKVLPKSEPPPEPKAKKSELDKFASKLDEIATDVKKVLAPKVAEPKKRESKWFDEFDITLNSEPDAEA